MSLKQFLISIMWNNTHYIKRSEKKAGNQQCRLRICKYTHVFTHNHRKRLEEIYADVHIVYLQVVFFFILFYTVQPPKINQWNNYLKHTSGIPNGKG